MTDGIPTPAGLKRALDSTAVFAAAVIVGALLRAAAMPLPGTGDVNVWKIWTYGATRLGATQVYGVGGSPVERRVIDFHGATATVDYPPLALDELAVLGHVYALTSGRRFPDTLALTATIKALPVLAEVALGWLLFVAVRRKIEIGAARWSVVAYWLNPAALLDAACLGYLDALFVLPAVAALVAAGDGRPLLAGGLMMAAILTKAQAIVVAPAVALLVWNVGAARSRPERSALGLTGATLVAAAIVGPVAAAGAWPNMWLALSRLAHHDMLSGNACNAWWIVGYVMRALYSMEDIGIWAAFTTPTRILQISRVVDLGYPNPRVVGSLATLAAMGWGLWTARQTRDLWLGSGLAAFLVHSYATLSAQVHENHLFAAVPLLVLAAAGRPRFRPILAAVSAVVALNLNLFYGISESVGYAIPRTATIVDATVIVAAMNCVALACHGAVLKRECASAPAGNAST